MIRYSGHTGDWAVRALLLVVLASVIPYAGAGQFPFQYDDWNNIVFNPEIQDIRNIPGFFAEFSSPLSDRPLVQTSFALNYALGGENPAGYHLFNVFLHALCVGLFFVLARNTCALAGVGEREALWGATAAALFFGLHPLQTETVSYITTRSALMVAACYMGAILLFGRFAGQGRAGWAAASAMFGVTLLGVASREDIATLPVMLLAYDWFFVARGEWRAMAGRWRLYLGVLAAMPYLALIVATTSAYTKTAGFAVEIITPLEYQITQFSVFWAYARLVLLPINQCIDYMFLPRVALDDTVVLVSMAAYLALWAVALLGGMRRRLWAYCLLWYLVTLLPAGSFVPLADFMIEHRLHMPLAGAGGLLAIAAIKAASGLEKAWMRRAIAGGLALVFCMMMLLAFARNALWADEVRLWEDVISKTRANYNALNNLGVVYSRAGDHEKALSAYKIGVELTGGEYYLFNYNYGLTATILGHVEEAVPYFEKAIKLGPPLPVAHYAIGEAHFRAERFSMAASEFRKALDLDEAYPAAWKMMGLSLYETDDLEGAEAALRKAMELSPQDKSLEMFLDMVLKAKHPGG